MKIYYPSYYKDFKCLADRCRHSCCIGWEIGIDEATIEKYKSLPDGDREDVMSHIGADRCVILDEEERCPFLCVDGLCRLISTYGEEYISHICREHPRFYHRVCDRVECGIGASCEEACRLILSSNFCEFYSFERDEADIADETDFDTISHREWIYSILSGGKTYREKLVKIMERYDIADPLQNKKTLNEALVCLEYLDEANREVVALETVDGREALHRYFERFFAYLVFRHLSVAESYDNMRARLGFCFLMLYIFENAVASGDEDFNRVCDIARLISEEIEYSEDNTASLIFEMECLN